WFPAAPQGEVSIYHGFEGHSKTFAGDAGAFIEATTHALLMLRLNLCDQVLVGAVEAVSSPWLREQLNAPARDAVGVLLLGREPDPHCGRPVVVEVGEAQPQHDLESPFPHGGRYPVDAASWLIAQLAEALQQSISLPVDLIDGVEKRRVRFTFG